MPVYSEKCERWQNPGLCSYVYRMRTLTRCQGTVNTVLEEGSGYQSNKSSRTPYGQVKDHHQEIEHLAGTQHRRADGRKIEYPVSVGSNRHLVVIYEKKMIYEKKIKMAQTLS
jgi:hypothetical protein